MNDEDVANEDYGTLARFRYELRRFLQFSEEAARRAGLTARQHQALLAIRAGPAEGMTVGEIAERMLLRPHSMTGLIDRLAEAGLAARVRDDNDRRQVRVQATARARALLASLADSHRAELRRLRPLLTDLMAGL
jgi:DNA-binding MarR family transcriptional regulator